MRVVDILELLEKDLNLLPIRSALGDEVEPLEQLLSDIVQM